MMNILKRNRILVSNIVEKKFLNISRKSSFSIRNFRIHNEYIIPTIIGTNIFVFCITREYFLYFYRMQVRKYVRTNLIYIPTNHEPRTTNHETNNTEHTQRTNYHHKTKREIIYGIVL